MATVSIVRSPLGGVTQTVEDGTVMVDGFKSSAVQALWSGFANAADVGAPLGFAQFADRTVQVEGSGSWTVVIEGSNDGSNWHTLHDAFGNALSLSAPALASIAEFVAFVRPRMTVGSSVSVNVNLVAHLSSK